MDFTHFSNVLQKLLIKNKNVTIPRIGCFVLEELNSEIQFSGKIITPPKTTLLFCTSEVDNDGELEKYLAEQNNITIAQAKIMLEDVVNDIVSALEVKGATILDGLGEISKGQNGELYFHPFNDDKSFMPNLPFEPVSIKPILKRDNNAIVDNIEIELEDDLPVASVPMEPIDVVKEDDDNQELSLDAISGTLDSDNELELEPKPIDGVKNENEDFGQEAGEELAEELAEEVVDNSSSKKQVSKKTIYLSILVIGLIVIIFLIYLFRENFSVVLENLLYNKEELEILRKAGKL